MTGNVDKLVVEATKLLGSEHVTTNLAMRHSYVARSVMGIRAGVAEAILKPGNSEEVQLLQKLIEFPQEVESAVADLNPSKIAAHVFNTAKAFNQFYNKHPVLKAKNEQFVDARLALIKATAVVLKNGLNLLGVEVLENM